MGKYKSHKITVQGINAQTGITSSEQTFFTTLPVKDEVLKQIHRSSFKYWPQIRLVSVEDSA